MGKGLDLSLDADKIETSNLGAFNGVSEKDHMKGSVNGEGFRSGWKQAAAGS